MRLWVVCIGLLTGGLVAQEPDDLRRGVELFKAAKYREAAAALKLAVAGDPLDANARLYLATAQMIQWVPGAKTAGNSALAREAESGFREVTRLSPDGPANNLAISSLASLAYTEAKANTDPAEKLAGLEKAKGCYERLAAMDPNNKDA